MAVKSVLPMGVSTLSSTIFRLFVRFTAEATWSTNTALFCWLVPTAAIFVAPSAFRTSALRVVNVVFGSGGWLFRHPNMFGYVPKESRPRCQPVTGMRLPLRYLALASAAGLSSMMPKTLSCSTSCWAAVTFLAGSFWSSTGSNVILRFPSSPSWFAFSMRASMPSFAAPKDGAAGPERGRMPPTLISLLLTPGSFLQGFGSLTGFRF